jgi:hypothetical protein
MKTQPHPNLALLEKKIIPDYWLDTNSNNWYDDGYGGHLDFKSREKCIACGGWSRVSWDWVRPLAKWIGNRRCLEVGAGLGMLAHALQTCGVDIKPTDSFSWEHYADKALHWTDIERLPATAAITKYGKDSDILVLCWTPFARDDAKDVAYQAACRYHVRNPNGLILYIGEGEWGCNASRAFFKMTTEVEDADFEKIAERFSRWYGLRDRLSLRKI